MLNAAVQRDHSYLVHTCSALRVAYTCIDYCLRHRQPGETEQLHVSSIVQYLIGLTEY